MKKLSSQQKNAFFLLGILLILISLIVVLAVSLRTDDVTANLGESAVVKVLVVLHDGDQALATDLFLFSPETKKGALFEIAGNVGAIYTSLATEDTEGRVDRIDTVYKEKGIEAYRTEIQKLLMPKEKLPYSIEINIDDFGLLTDLLGGIKVFIPSPVDAHGESGERWLLPSGAVNLDGDKVQTYMSYLLPDEAGSDREKRRQEVAVSFLSALNENRTVVTDKKNFPIFSSHMKSNLQESDFHTLVSLMSEVDCSTLTPQSIVGTLRTVDGQILLFPHLEGEHIQNAVKLSESSLLNGLMQNRVYVIDVFNGTSRAGLASNTAELLRGAGYDILAISNADESNAYRRYLIKYGDLAEGEEIEGEVEHTLLINHIGDEQVVQSLADFIRCKNIENEEVLSDLISSSEGTDVDFTLILGKDFDGTYVRGGYVRAEE